MIPLQDAIRNLKQQINTLTRQQDIFKQKLIEVNKPIFKRKRLIKKCACSTKYDI